jgi:monofunctional glycosyltransferase
MTKPVQVLGRILSIARAILLGYAVVFSLVGTVALVWGAAVVYRPIREVRRLEHDNPVESAFMADVRQELRAQQESDSLIHEFVPLDSISQRLVHAVLAAEDDGFYTHPGFDVAAILAAAEYNRAHNRVKHGGSTITQQVAKNLFLSSERTFNRKALELGYALLLETYLSKDRILELYLNYAQWGERIFGCEAAAREYFGTSCTKLTQYQAARLAATLAKPTKLNPRSSSSVLMGKRLKMIAGNLYYRHRIGASGFERLSGHPPPDAAENSDTSGQKAADTTVSPNADTAAAETDSQTDS